MNLKGRNFLKLMDFTPEEITYMIDLAADLKAKKKQGIPHDSLTGKNIALIFEKTSTRTGPCTANACFRTSLSSGREAARNPGRPNASASFTKSVLRSSVVLE